jgi:hypothetical protein
MDISPITLKLFDILAPLLTALVGYGVWALTRYIETKTHNVKVNEALDKLENITYTVVQELMNTTVKELKAKAADGTLTKEDAISIKNAAGDKIKSYVGLPGLKLLVTGDTDINKLIGSKIEAVLAQVKQVTK